jgi:hypothetical protein
VCKTRVFGRTAQHHSSEVSVDQKMLFSETEVLAAMESAEYVFARRLFSRRPFQTCVPSRLAISRNTTSISAGLVKTRSATDLIFSLSMPDTLANTIVGGFEPQSRLDFGDDLIACHLAR